MRRAPVLAVAALLVLSGCAGFGPSDDATTVESATTADAADPGETTTGAAETTTATTTDGAADPGSEGGTGDADDGQDDSAGEDDGPDLGIDVMNGPLEFDVNTTYARVQAMLGTNVSPPGAVMVIPGMNAAGSASTTGRVYLDAKDESVLAHEFAHSILLRAYPNPAVSTPDGEFAVNGLVEGAAEYTQAAYNRRYLDRPANYFRRLPEHPGRAYFLARYYFGYRYFDARADSPADVPALHETPPNTSEQVMHGLAPGDEPPGHLVVSIADRNVAANATWRYTGTDRLGEITVFLTLRSRLSERAATVGADGWGNDRLVSYRGDEGEGFVWVLRWDDPANATAFESAAEQYLDAPAPSYPAATDRQTPNAAFTDLVWIDSDASFALERQSEDTVVLEVGPESFLEAATVEGTGGNVSITVG